MNSKNPRSLLALASFSLCVSVLGVGATVLGCGAKKDGDSSAKPDSSSSSKQTSEPTKSAAPVPTASSTATPASSAAGGKKEVHFEHMLEKADSGKNERSGLLAVDMSGVDDSEAPALGGGGHAEQPKPAAGAALTWLDEGAVTVPNPGWKEKDVNATKLLSSPDGKMAFIFNHFTTDQDGTDKANKFIAAMKLTETTWKKAEKVKVGKDNLPAILGMGHGKLPGGVGAKVIYLLVKTGGPDNLMVIGVFDDTASKEDSGSLQTILENIRKK